jgi:hypothetical protein
MSLNAADAYNQALELFSSLYEDMFSTDLPAGLSPACEDVWFLPGLVQTRPALNNTIAIPSGETDLDTVSLTEFASPTGDFFTLWLYSDGSLWQQDDDTLTLTKIGTVSAGTQFRSVTAFEKQFFAFYNQTLSDAFSDSPFAGADVPRYLDKNGNLWRVTQDAPAVPPTFGNVQTLPYALVQTSTTGSPLTPTGVVTADPVTTTTRVPKNEGPGFGFVTTTVYYQLVYTCSSAVPSTWLGQIVAITGFTGTNASLVNITGQIIAVSGDTFTLGVYYTTSINNTTGGTATLTGNYLTRVGNIVSAFVGTTQPANLTPGFYVQVSGPSGAAINGPNWTIATIARDATGLVTVTLSTQLTNLAAGSQLYINASDVTDFPVGLQTVYQVLSASGGTTVFTISNPTWGNGAVTSSSAGGSVYQVWSGIYQILSLVNDPTNGWYITWFQLGPDTFENSTGGTVQVQAQVPGGPRSAVLIFESENGAQTAPSVPIQLFPIGGSNLLQASNLLIGPPGTAKRIIALTPAYGSSYFYITPSYIPSTAGLSPVIGLGTIVNDNTSISTILDFSDAQLTAGTEIDIAGNDLFNQVVLAPCLGCIEYQGRLGWWGEINDIKNLINGHFDGGYAPVFGTVDTSGTAVTLVGGGGFVNGSGIPVSNGSTIYINGVPYVIQSVTDNSDLVLTASAGVQTNVPFYILSANGAAIPGWTTSGLGAYLVPNVDPSLGFACQLQSSSGVAAYLEQPFTTDYYGGPIGEPLTTYIFRCLATYVPGNAVASTLTVQITSPTAGSLAVGSISVFPTTQGWISFTVTGILPAVMPTDAVIKISFESDAGGGEPATLTLDELELINASQPVLFQQMRMSYFDNEFGYDEETGLLGLDGSAKITAAFKQRGYLYALSDGPLFQTQNTGQGEPNTWPFPAFGGDGNCFGPNAVTTTDPKQDGSDIAWWAGAMGLQVFNGGPPKKLSQELQPSWESINQNAPTAVWIQNDSVERLVYVGIPTGTATKCNLVLPMSYRAVDAAYNVPDPIHTSYSGKVIATDLCRKWTRWNMPMSCGAMLTRPGLQRQMFFGGQEHSNFYSLNFAKYTDDDYGQIFSYYTTYFFFNHDIEQNTPALGLHQKLFSYLTAYITGVGFIQPTALANNLDNEWETTAAGWDPINLTWIESGSPSNPFASVPLTNGVLLNDLEWGLNIKNVARVAIKWQSSPNPAGDSPKPATDSAFVLTHMVMSCREDRVSPVRGSNIPA